MGAFRTLDDISPAGRRVLLRLDLNVPIDGGRVTASERIARSLATVRELAEKGARTIILAHLGRPGGRPDPSLSLAPVAAAIADALGRPVAFATDTIGDSAAGTIASAGPGDVAVLENLRFHPGEEADDRDFAHALGALGDIYVNDAFSVSHRAHASVTSLARLLPSCAGRLMEEEVNAIARALTDPARPVAAVVGGAKVSTKLAILDRLSRWADHLVVGGAMANTFLAAQGTRIGASLHEADMTDTADRIMRKARERGHAIHLPVDAVVEENGRPAPCGLDAIGRQARILDIGPLTVAAVSRLIGRCRTVVWNGPMGMFERAGFDSGTVELARTIADLTQKGKVFSVAGGGDTAAALTHAGATDGFSYVSTAGGAFLQWLEGTPLPGLVALEAA